MRQLKQDYCSKLRRSGLLIESQQWFTNLFVFRRRGLALNSCFSYRSDLAAGRAHSPDSAPPKNKKRGGVLTGLSINRSPLRGLETLEQEKWTRFSENVIGQNQPG